MQKTVSVDDKTVIFIAFHGRGYTDNPKYIHQEMLRQTRFDDYKMVWPVKKPKQTSIERAV